MKKCLKCNIEKDLADFNRDKRDKSGYNTQCRICISKRRNKVNNNISVENKFCNYCNLDKHSSCFKKQKDNKDGLYHMCKECFNVWRKEYRRNDDVSEREILQRKNLKEYYTEYNKIWRENNKDKVKEYNDKSRSTPERKEYCRLFNKEYNKERRKSDIIFRLKGNLRNYLRIVLIQSNYRKKQKTSDILGCSYEQFRIYIESRFETWMTWDNYGRYNGELNHGWDLDHIIPLSSANTEEEVLNLFHYKNTQPLCSYTNRYIKRDKILN